MSSEVKFAEVSFLPVWRKKGKLDSLFSKV